MATKQNAAERAARQREVWRADTLEELKAIEVARGYGFGWANRVWQAKQQRKGTR